MKNSPNMQVRILINLLGLISLLMFGCASPTTSDDTPIPEDENIKIGQLLDSPVSGITYVTETKNGKTDSEGRFFYAKDETVTFSIGDTDLGAAKASDVVTLFDLVEEAKPSKHMEVLKKYYESGKYNAVINIGKLLQTLDYDGDPENGIEITTEIAALFDEIKIEFNQFPQVFAKDPNFRKILNEANDGSLLKDYRQIRKNLQVLNHVFSHLDDGGIWVKSTMEIDSNGDGEVDRFFLYTYDNNERMIRTEEGPNSDTINRIDKFFYDENGNIIRDEYDRDGNGTSDSVDLYTYDSNDNQTSYAYDSGADGTMDSCTDYFFDKDGNLTRKEYDSDGDGVPSYIENFSYDTHGNETKKEVDRDADGVLDWSYEYTFDANNNMTSMKIDEDGDGIPESIYRYEFDESNKQTKKSYEKDGILKHSKTFVYDDHGNEIRWEYDFNGDGIADQVTNKDYTYDANDNIVLIKRDNNNDGTTDTIYRFEYDEFNNLTYRGYDNNADGTADDIERFTFDTDGNLLQKTYDYNGDGEPDSINTYTYHDNGILAQHEYDSNGDGSPNRVTCYDSEGNETCDQQDNNDDNVMDRIYTNTYTYEENGDLKKVYERDNDADGIVDQTETIIYKDMGSWREASRQAGIDETEEEEE